MGEQSTVSQAESSEMPQESGASQKADSGYSTRKVAIAIIPLLLLLLLIGLIIHGAGGDSVEETSGGSGSEGDVPGGHVRTSSGSSSKPPSAAPPKATNAAESAHNATTTGPKRTTSATETPRTTTTTTGPKRKFYFDKEAVICVYGTGFDESLQFPDEGMCDMTLLDSLYKDGRNPFDGPFEKDYDHFISHARKQKKDQFGLSFDFPNYKKLDDLIAGNGAPDLIRDRWNDRIFHYAMIDISPYQQSESDVMAAVTAMKKMHSLLKDQADITNDTDAFIALGFSPLSDQWNQFISTMLRDYKPDIFVLLGHYTVTNHDQPSCKMAPPNIYKHRDGFNVSMEDAHNTLKQRAPDCGECALAVSLTLAGRYNKPVQDYMPFLPCERLPNGRHQLGSFSEVCGNFKIKRLQTAQTIYAYTLHERLTMLYDSPQTMAFKLCDFKSNLTDVKYGIAVFDLQYEPATPLCGFPKFSRIEMARRLTKYFKAKFEFHANRTNCLELFDPPNP